VGGLLGGGRLQAGAGAGLQGWGLHAPRPCLGGWAGLCLPTQRVSAAQCARAHRGAAAPSPPACSAPTLPAHHVPRGAATPLPPQLPLQLHVPPLGQQVNTGTTGTDAGATGPDGQRMQS